MSIEIPKRDSGSDRLTIYKPDYDDSSGLESENSSSTSDTSLNNHNGSYAPMTPIRHGPSRKQIAQTRPSGWQELSTRDLDLLTLVTTAADKTDTKENGTLNFTNLSLALNSFLEANGLTPETYANYDLCIYTVMLLCNYDLPTWRARLEAFIEEYGHKEKPRKVKTQDTSTNRRPKLEKLEKRVSLMLVSQYMRFWSAKSQYVRTISNDMTRIAVSLDTKSLLKETIRCWSSKIEDQSYAWSNAVNFYDCKLAIRTIRLLKRRTIKAQENDSKLENYRREKAFKRWKIRADILKKYSDDCVEFYNRNLARRHLVDWLYRSYEQRITRAYESKLLKTKLYHWMNRNDQIIEYRDYSKDMDSTFSTGKVFNHWVMRTADGITDTRLAEKLYNGQLAKRSLDLWMFKTDMTIRFRVVQKMSGRKLSAEIFGQWKQKAFLLLEADNFQRLVPLGAAFKKWKLAAGHKKAEKQVKGQILKQSMQRWILLERSLLYGNYKRNELKSQIFKRWLKKTAKSYKTQYRNTALATKMHNTALRTNVLYHWYKVHTINERNEALSVLIRTRSLVKSPLHKMMAHTRTTREQEMAAIEIEKGHLLHKAMSTWQLRAVKSVTMRLALAKARFEQSHNEVIKQNILKIWRYKHEAVITNKEVAILVDGKLFMNHIKVIIKSWKEHTDNISGQRQMASDYYTESLLANCLNRWKVGRQKVEDISEEAEFLDDCRILKAQERLFRTWSTQSFKITSQERNAEEFHSRLQKTRFRKLWKHWRAKVTEKQYAAQPFEDTAQNTPTRSTYADILRRRGAETLPLSLLRQSYRDSNESLAQGSTILETPSRIRFKTSVPATTVERWIKNRSGRLTPSTARPSPMSLTRDFLQNEVTPPRR